MSSFDSGFITGQADALADTVTRNVDHTIAIPVGLAGLGIDGYQQWRFGYKMGVHSVEKPQNANVLF